MLAAVRVRIVGLSKSPLFVVRTAIVPPVSEITPEMVVVPLRSEIVSKPEFVVIAPESVNVAVELFVISSELRSKIGAEIVSPALPAV